MGTAGQRGVALVTGGAAGIGRAIALTLARSGHDIAVFDTAEVSHDHAAELQAVGVRSLYVNVDVSQQTQVRAGYETVHRQLGPPVVLVNNAGIYPRAPALEMAYSQWKEVLETNLGGAFLCSQVVAPAMLEQRDGGVIVNIASGRALQGAVRGCHYAASKAGILSLTQSLALEWAPSIRVNAVIPGLTDTAQPRQGCVSDEQLHARGESLPLKRIGQPQDVAWAVDYLVSAKASYITGQSLCVNGGSIMR